MASEVPTYVMEYLLGKHCATEDPTLIAEGLESVRRILAGTLPLVQMPKNCWR